MATTNRQQTTAIAEKLWADPTAYDFFQAVRMLTPKNIQFVGSHSFAFPKGDIESLRPNKTRDKWTMAITFLSLIGSHGQLPSHYTEQLLKQLQQKDTALRDFLNLLQQRSVELFYKAWEKHHFYVGYEHAKQQQTTDAFSQTLYSLAGLGTKAMQQKLPTTPENIAFYSGFFANTIRCAANLRAMLTSFFQIQVKIQELQGEWLSLNSKDCTKLGKPSYLGNFNNRLGIDTSAGTRVWHCNNKFRIQLGPLSKGQLNNFLPNGSWFAVLQKLVSLYVGMEFNFDVQLTLDARYIKATQFKKTSPLKLGWNSWLCSTPATTDRNDIILTTGENTYAIN
jgi:type VI secretion system protein ImpH